MDGVRRHVITGYDYNQAVIRLLRAGHRYTSCDGNVVAVAAAEANWRLEQPFLSIVSSLYEDPCDLDSAVHVIGSFLHELWTMPITPRRAPELIIVLLNAVATHHSGVDLLQRMISEVQHRFALRPGLRAQVLRMLRGWAEHRFTG